MKNKVLLTIILTWTILSFLIDLYSFIITPGEIILRYLIILVGIEGAICWISYQALIKKKWALIVLTIYYGIHIITYSSNNFTINIRSGIDLHLTFGDSFGINLLPMIFFLLLLSISFTKTNEPSKTELLTNS